MKFILAALAVAFTVGFVSPSFADDNEAEGAEPGSIEDNLLRAILGDPPLTEAELRADSDCIWANDVFHSRVADLKLSYKKYLFVSEGEYEFDNKAEGLRIMEKNIRNQAEDTSMWATIKFVACQS